MSHERMIIKKISTRNILLKKNVDVQVKKRRDFDRTTSIKECSDDARQEKMHKRKRKPFR